MIKNKTSLRGFTLLELIVVIAIIGVLSVIILPSFTTALARSRDGRKISELRGLQAGLIQFAQNNNGLYPGTGTSSTMPTAAVGCSTASTTVGLCSIIASGIDNRLPAGVYAGTGQVYNYVGQACYAATGLCQSYQLWTSLEQSNPALANDADSSATSAATTTNVFGGSLFLVGGLQSAMITTVPATANGQAELCNGTAGTCIFDLVP